MSKASIVAKNYAKALFSVAKKDSAIDKVMEQLDIFKKNFSESFAHELQNPVISRPDLVEIMAEITKKFSFDATVSNFLLTLAYNKRLALFLEVYQEFVSLVKIQKNILSAEVIFASKADKSQIDQIRLAIEKKYSGKTVEITEKLDEKILGGFQVKINSNIIDLSLKTQLSSLKQELVNDL
ncbi:MAG: ATP synthase F1 subunit delta [Pelagibacterales bacterium]|nr:ATP synthase F1 subunit delta [Pelagibacterales bacterium]